MVPNAVEHTVQRTVSQVLWEGELLNLVIKKNTCVQRCWKQKTENKPEMQPLKDKQNSIYPPAGPMIPLKKINVAVHRNSQGSSPWKVSS